MPVRDAKKPPPSDAPKEAWDRWLNEVVYERLNIDVFNELTSPAGGDEIAILDASADQTKKITLTNLLNQTLLKTALGVSVGNWTPVLGATVTSGTHTYATQFGRYLYVQAFNRVWLDFFIDITTKDSSGTTSGNLQITGLPYASLNTTGYRAQAILRYATLDLNVGAGRYMALGTIGVNSQVLALIEQGDNTGTAVLTEVDFANGTQIQGSFSYETA